MTESTELKPGIPTSNRFTRFFSSLLGAMGFSFLLFLYYHLFIKGTDMEIPFFCILFGGGVAAVGLCVIAIKNAFKLLNPSQTSKCQS